METVLKYAQWIVMLGENSWGDPEPTRTANVAAIDATLPTYEVDGVSVSMTARQMASSIARLSGQVRELSASLGTEKGRTESLRKELATAVRSHSELKTHILNLAKMNPRKISKADIQANLLARTSQ